MEGPFCGDDTGESCSGPGCGADAVFADIYLGKVS